MQVAADIDISDGELEGRESIMIEDQVYAQPTLKTSLDERHPLPYRHSVEDIERKEAGIASEV